MLKIYHSPLSRSLRVVWLCEEIGLLYALETLEMFSEELKRPEYLRVHPLGKVPAIDDDGFVLWETAAIFEHLVAKYGDGALLPPRDTPDGARAIQWLTYGENPLSVIMGEVAAHEFAMPEDMRIPALASRGRELAPALVNVVERALGSRPFILGDDFSAPDIMLGFGLNIARYLGFVSDETPSARDYCDRLADRPAYQRALAA
jgi:glutathione S-transferase